MNGGGMMWNSNPQANVHYVYITAHLRKKGETFNFHLWKPSVIYASWREAGPIQ